MQCFLVPCQTLWSAWFAPVRTLDQMVTDWKRQITREKRKIQRDVLAITRGEGKLRNEIKAAAGDAITARVVAKEMLKARKQRDRLAASVCNLDVVDKQLTLQRATLRLQNAFSNAGNIAHAMNSLVSVPQLNRTVTQMAREMERAGIIDGLVDEMLDNAHNNDADAEKTVDEAADAEVDKVMQEILGGVPKAPTTKLRTPQAQTTQTKAALDKQMEEEYQRLLEVANE